MWYTSFMSIPLSIRTVCCKLAVDAAADAALRQTQTAFNAAASYCATVAWDEQVTNKNKLHYLVYGETRITYRLISLDRVSLNTLIGRVIGQLVLGDFQRRYLYDTTWKIGGAELMRRDGIWYLCITQSKDAPAPDEPQGYLGVDLGIVNLAA